MSLSSTTNKVIYNGNGATSAWPFSFPVLDAGHLAVVFTDGAGLETVLSPSLYAVAGIGAREGGSVTYPLAGSPIATGTKLTLVRTVPYTQTTVLSNQGGYYPEVVEQRLDLVYMAMQQLAEIVSRYTVSSISNPATEQTNYTLIQALQAWQSGIDKLTTAGDMLTHTGSAYARLSRGAAGEFLGVNGTALAWLAPGIRSYLAGLTLSTAGSSTTFGITAGVAMNDTAARLLSLASAFAKTTSAWAVGTGNGALDTGAIANSTWYHVFLIATADLSVVDVLISTSASAPTMPTTYTLKRRIGALRTNGSGQWQTFFQHGDKFIIPYVTDFTPGGTSAMTLRTMSVPTGIQVEWLGWAGLSAGGGTSTGFRFAPATDASMQMFQVYVADNSIAFGASMPASPVTTNNSGQIYIEVFAYAGGSVCTYGWIDRRGQDG